MDKEKKKLLLSCIKKDGPIILDIGANNGKDTSFFLRKFDNSFVYSFEPDPRALKDFKKRARKHGKPFRRNKLFEYALSDHDGVENFYMAGCSGSSSLREPLLIPDVPFFDSQEFKDVVEIKTKKLDTWCEENNINEIDCIWSDLQGGEDKMIRGGKESLKKTKLLIIEYIYVEAYKGIKSKDDILRLLPDFEIIRDFKGTYQSDIFLKNINYK